MSGSRKCSFKIEWLSDPTYKTWVEECKTDNNVVFCRLCKKNVDIANMGVSALKSHMMSAKHKKLASTEFISKPVSDYFKVPATKTEMNLNLSSTSMSIVSDCKMAANMSPPSVYSQAIVAESALKAEVLWTLNVVKKHMSLNSCKDNNQLFALMFPDSAIAKKYSCGADKCSYLLSFGIAPYFKNELIHSIRQSDFFVACFDGTVNKFIQKEQIDIVIRFWDQKCQLVQTRYVGSQFLGHTTAKDIKGALQSGISELNSMNLLQIGMDGPNVNLKVLKDYEMERREDYPDYPLLIDIGSCSVHSVHRAFQIGNKETDWNIDSMLRCLWFIFKDSPARRTDFLQQNTQKMFPLKFCATRWVEDVAVAERAIAIWPEVLKFIDSYKDKPKSLVCAKSFETVRMACKDPFLIAKLSFFSFIGKQVHLYLTSYQTDSPMIPFQAPDILEMLYGLMSLFVKKEVLDKAKNHADLVKIDVIDKKNVVFTKDIEIGFATRKVLNTCVAQKKVSEKDTLIFKSECLRFLQSMTKKLLKNNPLKYPIVRLSTCLDPRSMFGNETETTKTFSLLLLELHNKKLINASVCDTALLQLKLFLNEMKTEASIFKDFDRKVQRLDAFFSLYLAHKKEYIDLWKIIKMILTLSHGQASVERGYSVNKEMIIENLKEENLVAMRIVYDALKFKNLNDIILTKELLTSARASRMRYQHYLEEKKKTKSDEEKGRKRSLELERLCELKKKKAKFEKAVEMMMKEADTMALSAEKKSDFTLLVKSNAYRKKSLESKKEVAKLDEEIIKLSKTVT